MPKHQIGLRHKLCPRQESKTDESLSPASLIKFTFQKFDCETHRESQFIVNVAGVEDTEKECY